jgi:hypothetical protein
MRAGDLPEGVRRVGDEMSTCPTCGRWGMHTVYGAFGAVSRTCWHCRARSWGCSFCGVGPAIELHPPVRNATAVRRCVVCRWTGLVPTAERPAPRMLRGVASPQSRVAPQAAPVVERHVEPATVEVPTEPPQTQTVSSLPKRQQRPRKTPAAPAGQGSLF